jgi:hypothetical protein
MLVIPFILANYLEMKLPHPAALVLKMSIRILGYSKIEKIEKMIQIKPCAL